TRTDLGEWATPGPSIASQLSDIGLKPDEIRFVALSHGHWDHSGNGGLFSAATWIVNPLERAAMFDDESRQSPAMDEHGALETSDTLLIEDDHDAFGARSVMIAPAPGPPPG